MGWVHMEVVGSEFGNPLTESQTSQTPVTGTEPPSSHSTPQEPGTVGKISLCDLGEEQMTSPAAAK